MQRPSFISVGDAGSYVSVIWRIHSSFTGVNVYRNGDYVTSVNTPGNVFNDHAVEVGDRNSDISRVTRSGRRDLRRGMNAGLDPRISGDAVAVE